MKIQILLPETNLQTFAWLLAGTTTTNRRLSQLCSLACRRRGNLPGQMTFDLSVLTPGVKRNAETAEA